ncbi:MULTISPECIES: SusC/RagA family TonB-linked outer membrane protein [Butyricimonas]|uniref:SusC/RagA family TonB-linked outer membrane protein n=1 Tax=Butyricimonas TaxID=574697 RepID=UPI001D08D5A0|nr:MULTISPECIES: SusC/RagA family TonB-linked outer membrane protein [Butyricimonas]MCB6970835.1 SusC/RagA family TonB-linked outer membrane protein [Butyricimonas synergistica]MCG4517549.1 SusC/RagA family TonB-linked outer membrane protein [Butyricimonas sp. DFI.6.44]
MKKNFNVVRKRWFLFLLFLVFTTQLSQRAYCQEVKMTFSLKNATLKEVINEIKRISAYDFVYSDSYLSAFKQRDVSYKDATIDAVLTDCLKGTGLIYAINGQTIVIRREETKAEQTKVVAGKVSDMNGSPLPGVTILIKGLTVGTVSDVNGNYKLGVPTTGEVILMFSFIGMKTQYITVKEKLNINVKMEEDVAEMDEVVITGYQTIDKKHLTSAITTVNAADVLVPGMTSIDQALEGRIPELLLMTNSGEVGATPRIRVRGTSTLLGNREPLWVLDGFILDDPVDVSNDDLNNPDYINIIGNAIAGINPQDIERIDVLKDASATALYGTRAANGVIVVTTKKGAIGPARVSYNHSSKYTRRPRYSDRNINLMNSQQRVQFGKDLTELHYPFPSNMPMVGYEGAAYRLYTGQTNYDEFLDEVKRYETVNTDWFDILTQDTYSHDHTLSVSGGTESVRYYASLGYNYEDGVSKTTYTERYTARINMDMTFSEKVKASFSLDGNVQKKNHLMPEIDAMDYAYNTTRALPCYNPDGTLYYYEKSAYNGMNRWASLFRYNILNEIDNSSNSYDGNTLGARLNLKYSPWRELDVTVAGNYNRSSTLQEQWWGEKSHYAARWKNAEYEEVPMPGDDGECYLPYGGILKTTNTINESYVFRVQYDFRKPFGSDDQHMIMSTGGFEMNGSTSRSISDENRGYVKDRGMQFIDEVDLTLYTRYAKWLNENHRTLKHGISHQVSGYLTLSYSYGNHFTLYANARCDFSNKFGSQSNDKFLPIWAISGSWNLKENILRNWNFVNEARFRTSYGYQGNMLDDQSPNLTIKQGTIDPMYNENVSVIARYPNPNLKWEETHSFDLGLDLSFFKSRVNIEGSLYFKKTEDCFTSVRVSTVNGLSNYTMNSGDLKNDGYSIALQVKPIKTKDFQWLFSTQYSGNMNKVESETVEVYTIDDYLNGTAIINGTAIGSFYSYKFLGLSPENGTPVFDDYADRQHLLKYKSLEETVLMIMEKSGQREPKFSGNFANTFTYKNFTLTMNMAYGLGSKVRLFALYEPIVSGVSAEANVRKEFLNRWQVPGDETKTNIPAILSPADADYMHYYAHFSSSLNNATHIQKFARSTWDMYDKSNLRVVSGNYLRCNSMSLRYTFGKDILSYTPFEAIQVSLNAMNLFTLSAKELKGQDPSQSGFAKPNLSVRPSYTFQFNVTF